MALSRETANRIVDAVAADPECVSRIRSVFALIPGAQSGAVRNFGIATVNNTSMLANDAYHWVLQRDPKFRESWLGQWLDRKDLTVMDPGDPAVERYVCTGIASATLTALRQAKAASPAAFERVAELDLVSRTKPYDHTATFVATPDGEYVFDWWKTLHPACPMIYHQADFLLNRGGVLHLHFGGFA